MNDFVFLTAEIAFQAYEQGKLTRQQLFNTLEGCINVIAIENGYADQLGLPFPDHQFDNSDVIVDDPAVITDAVDEKSE